MINSGMKIAADSLFRACACAQEIRLGKNGAVDPKLGSGEVRLREMSEGAAFACAEAVFHRGHTVDIDIGPDEMMIFCVTGGRMRLRCDFLPEWDIGDGSIIYSAPERSDSVKAQLEAYPGDKFCLAIVSISRSAWRRMCGEGLEPEFLYLKSVAPLVSAFLPETDALFREMCFIRMHNLESERVLLLANALRAVAYIFDSASGEDKALGADRERMLVKNLPNRMMRDVMRPPTIPEMAREIGISPTKLKTLFREIHGTSIYAAFREAKLTLAGELLDTTGSSVREVAFQCGYQSQGQFTEAFRGKFGMTPSEYRQRRDEG